MPYLDFNLYQWLSKFTQVTRSSGEGEVCGICYRQIPSGAPRFSDDRNGKRAVVSVQCDLKREQKRLLELGFKRGFVLKIDSSKALKENYILALMSAELTEAQNDHLKAMLIRYGGQEVVRLIEQSQQQLQQAVAQ